MDGRFAIPHTDLDDEMDVGEEAGLDGQKEENSEDPFFDNLSEFKPSKRGIPKTDIPESEEEEEAIDDDLDDFWGNMDDEEEEEEEGKDLSQKAEVMDKPNEEAISDGSSYYSGSSYSYDYSYGYDYGYDYSSSFSESEDKDPEAES